MRKQTACPFHGALCAMKFAQTHLEILSAEHTHTAKENKKEKSESVSLIRRVSFPMDTCVCVSVCVCVRAHARARARVCVCVCMHACTRQSVMSVCQKITVTLMCRQQHIVQPI